MQLVFWSLLLKGKFENNLVMIHSCVRLDENQKIIVVHIFRFENDKIIEMWDCWQIIPKDLINKDEDF